MGRRLLPAVATFSGYELDSLKKNFSVERNELEDGTLEIISPIEVIYRTPILREDSTPAYLLESELVSIGRRTKTVTSTKYHILSASEILQRMFTTEVYDAIRKDVQSVGIGVKGGVIVKFKEALSHLEVLDANRYDMGIKLYDTPSEFRRKDFSKYNPVLMINNSMDRSMSVSAIAGLYRQICSNGMYDLIGMFGEDVIDTGKHRHFSTQSKAIADIVDRSIEALPRFSDIAGKVERFRDRPVTKSVDFLHETLDNWIEEKRQVKTIQNNKNFSDNAERLYQVWRTNIHKVENLLDLENLMGYFKNPERFGSQVAVLAKELENRLIVAF